MGNEIRESARAETWGIRGIGRIGGHSPDRGDLPILASFGGLEQ